MSAKAPNLRPCRVACERDEWYAAGVRAGLLRGLALTAAILLAQITWRCAQ